jgi:N-acetyl-anhydromuramyl-L-alanine amidase AmpD
VESLQHRVKWIDEARWNGGLRSLSDIQYIIAHDTAAPGRGSFMSSLRYLNETLDKKASYHYGIERDGDIPRMLHPKYIAWGCGDSAWPNPVRATPANPNRPNGGRSLNPIAISIAWANEGNGEPLTPEQIESGLWIFRFWMDKLDLPPSRVLGHYEISPGRKPDPELCMPMPTWRKMLSEVV